MRPRGTGRTARPGSPRPARFPGIAGMLFGSARSVSAPRHGRRDVASARSASRRDAHGKPHPHPTHWSSESGPACRASRPWASRQSNWSTTSAGTAWSTLTIPLPSVRTYGDFRYDPYNRRGKPGGRTFCAIARTFRDAGLFAVGGRRTGMGSAAGGVGEVMDTEHTGVGNEALDAYSRVVTGVAAKLLPSVAALSV